MAPLNRAFLRILALGWLGFAIATVTITQVFAVPDTVVLIDRSYCDVADWSTVATQYEQIYKQHQRQQIHLTTVVVVSDLGEESHEEPLTPEAVKTLRTYGRPNTQRLAALQTTYPKAMVLSCPTHSSP